jgi:hypothetical protein
VLSGLSEDISPLAVPLVVLWWRGLVLVVNLVLQIIEREDKLWFLVIAVAGL